MHNLFRFDCQLTEVCAICPDWFVFFFFFFFFAIKQINTHKILTDYVNNHYVPTDWNTSEPAHEIMVLMTYM